jgi:hypothetical protein
MRYGYFECAKWQEIAFHLIARRLLFLRLGQKLQLGAVEYALRPEMCKTFGLQ